MVFSVVIVELIYSGPLTLAPKMAIFISCNDFFIYREPACAAMDYCVLNNRYQSYSRLQITGIKVMLIWANLQIIDTRK